MSPERTTSESVLLLIGTFDYKNGKKHFPALQRVYCKKHDKEEQVIDVVFSFIFQLYLLPGQLLSPKFELNFQADVFILFSKFTGFDEVLELDRICLSKLGYICVFEPS